MHELRFSVCQYTLPKYDHEVIDLELGTPGSHADMQLHQRRMQLRKCVMPAVLHRAGRKFGGHNILTAFCTDAGVSASRWQRIVRQKAKGRSNINICCSGIDHQMY